MKFLVTGGAGFIGSNFCEFLLKKNHDVICLDNLNSGSKTNIKHLSNYENFNFVKKDILKPLNYDADWILNFASPASPKKYQEDPIFTLNTNFIGTQNLLELSKKNKISFLQASTSEVYGDPLTHPQNEKYFGNVNTFGPRSCYDEGKRISESLCYEYQKKHNVNIRIPRIFNTYGPNMDIDDGRVISNFIVAALKKKDLTIYGDGNQTRSFCYIDDLIDGIYKLLSKKSKRLMAPINIGNPTELTINDIAKLVLDLCNSKSKIKYMKIPQDDPQKRKPDISKITKELNWEPKVNIKNGILKTIEYFNKILKLST